MNKAEIIERVAKDVGLTKAAATGAVESVLDSIVRTLKKGNSASFVGFGSFKVATRKARTARNPKTGASIKLPKRRVPRFTPGKALKAAVK